LPKIKEAIFQARKKGYKIAFSKSIQRLDSLPENIKLRQIKERGVGRYMKPDSWGSGFFHIRPKENDEVFEKAGYDIFTNTKFEEWLIENKIEKIVVCGVFLDVCIDSTIRTAYQKGYFTVLLTDATQSLFYRKEEVEKFMKKFYGTKTLTVNEFFNDAYR